jgi:hypothetical protein
MATILHQDEWITISFDAENRLVRYTRSAVPYPDLGAVERSLTGVRALLLPVSGDLRLLIDVRLAPPRNDAGFEAQINGAIEGVWKRFGKVATLVRTAVGKLQTARLAHARGVEDAHVFGDEGEALAYLGVAAKPRGT